MTSGCILFAGGGTGGHIYPNVGIWERIRDQSGVEAHFLVSNRPGDDALMRRIDEPFTASPMRPLPSLRRPLEVPGFLRSWASAAVRATRLLKARDVGAIVATGGFVSGPAVLAAARLRMPRAMVNLDAVPGQANRHLARLCTKVFTTYETPLLPGAERIGLPLRRASVGPEDRRAAKAELGFDPEAPLLFVTGATHGAESVILTMIALVGQASRATRFAGWTVFHQCGTFDRERLEKAYADAEVHARVVAYSDQMGLAWRAADLVLSRAGAGSVAEAWANAAPSVFMPNPYHKDQHQRFNAAPLVEAGGATIVDDHVDPDRNLDSLAPALFELMQAPQRREEMRTNLARTRPPDGADVVARWLLEELAGS